MFYSLCIVLYFFNDPSASVISTLSLHDALPIYPRARDGVLPRAGGRRAEPDGGGGAGPAAGHRLTHRARGHRHVQPGADRRRSEEHTSELQSRQYLVCRLLLEKKKTNLSTLSIS